MKKKQNSSSLHIVGKFNLTEKVLINILAVLLFLIVIFPFYWIILTSFKTPFEIYEVPPKFYPTRLSLFNYVDAFKNYKIGRFAINSLIVTVSTVVGTTIASALAAYAIARLDFFGSKHIQALLAASQMFPVVVLLVPLFIFCVRLNLYDSHLSLSSPTSLSRPRSRSSSRSTTSRTYQRSLRMPPALMAAPLSRRSPR